MATKKKSAPKRVLPVVSLEDTAKYPIHKVAPEHQHEPLEFQRGGSPGVLFDDTSLNGAPFHLHVCKGCGLVYADLG